MSKSLYSKPTSDQMQTAELQGASNSGTEDLPIHPVKLILPGRHDTPSATAPNGGTLPSASTTHELIDKTTSRLLIYKRASDINEANVATDATTTKVQLGAFEISVTKVIRGFYVSMIGCCTLRDLLIQTLRTELIQKKSRALRPPR